MNEDPASHKPQTVLRHPKNSYSNFFKGLGKIFLLLASTLLLIGGPAFGVWYFLHSPWGMLSLLWIGPLPGIWVYHRNSTQAWVLGLTEKHPHYMLYKEGQIGFWQTLLMSHDQINSSTPKRVATNSQPKQPRTIPRAPTITPENKIESFSQEHILPTKGTLNAQPNQPTIIPIHIPTTTPENITETLTQESTPHAKDTPNAQPNKPPIIPTPITTTTPENKTEVPTQMSTLPDVLKDYAAPKDVKSLANNNNIKAFATASNPDLMEMLFSRKQRIYIPPRLTLWKIASLPNNTNMPMLVEALQAIAHNPQEKHLLLRLGETDFGLAEILLFLQDPDNAPKVAKITEAWTILWNLNKNLAFWSTFTPEQLAVIPLYESSIKSNKVTIEYFKSLTPKQLNSLSVFGVPQILGGYDILLKDYVALSPQKQTDFINGVKILLKPKAETKSKPDVTQRPSTPHTQAPPNTDPHNVLFQGIDGLPPPKATSTSSLVLKPRDGKLFM